MCNGGDVMQRMELVKTFKEEEAKVIVQQLVAGLCFFHSLNIVHRDLKLDNLMFNNGILKIIDFGLAGDCTDGPLNTPCGTIHFTAPEVLSSYDYTTAADMWSLGMSAPERSDSLHFQIRCVSHIPTLCTLFGAECRLYIRCSVKHFEYVDCGSDLIG